MISDTFSNSTPQFLPYFCRNSTVTTVLMSNVNYKQNLQISPRTSISASIPLLPNPIVMPPTLPPTYIAHSAPPSPSSTFGGDRHIISLVRNQRFISLRVHRP